jgi:hypothetical protein
MRFVGKTEWKVLPGENRKEMAIRYAPKVVIGATQVVVNGNPKGADIFISSVECQNLTIAVNAFSKKLANLKAAIALHSAYYNYCRIHQTFRGRARDGGWVNRSSVGVVDSCL